MCELVLCISGLGLVLGKFRQFVTELSAQDMIMTGYYLFTFFYFFYFFVMPCCIRFSSFPFRIYFNAFGKKQKKKKKKKKKKTEQ